MRTYRRGTMTCQYALPLLRWLGRAPEDFLDGPGRDVGSTRLPEAGPDRRLRFDLPVLHAAVDAHRRAEGLTWAALAEQLATTPGRLTNLRTARLADAVLVVELAQRLGRPAAAFVRATRW